MNYLSVGLLAGLLLAIATTTGGFPGFLLGLVLGAVGLGVGAVIEGRVDLGSLAGGRRRG
jgi:uncharacterized membrane protein